VSEQVELCYSLDGESYNFESLLEAITAMHQPTEGCIVHVGEKKEHDPASFFDADDILESAGERAYDEGGEWADDWPDVTPEARTELDDFLTAWFRKHATCHFYTVVNVKEYAITEQDLIDAGCEQEPSK
jgi:hypothetical protein